MLKKWLIHDLWSIVYYEEKFSTESGQQANRQHSFFSDFLMTFRSFVLEFGNSRIADSCYDNLNN